MYSLLCCPRDGATLLDDGSCGDCGRIRLGSDGILRLMPRDLHVETEHEMRIRDAAAAGSTPRDGVSGRGMSVADDLEIDCTLRALDLQPHHLVLEIGAGTGRFTRLIQGRSKHVVAADVSLNSLLSCQRSLSSESPVTLVQADASAPFAAPGAFDRILGTLASNLPGEGMRRASYRMAARACRPDGLFVFTTHHYCIRSRVSRLPRQGRYASGIHRSLLTTTEVRRELSPYWSRVRVRPIVVIPPLARRLRMPLALLDVIGQKLPGLRAFGELLLVEAWRPVHDTVIAA